MIVFTLGALALAAEPPHPEMHAFLTFALEARDATIQGDLDVAREKMKRVAKVRSEGDFPEAVQSHLIAMRSAAEAGEKSRSVDEMGRAVSRMAAACGACHSATEGGPDFGRIGRPPKGKYLPEHMELHAWSASRMWEGLVVADSERWKAGAEALFEESWVHPAAENDPKGSVFANRVHETGKAAVVASTDVQRTALYGQFVASCAACHRSKAD